MLKKISTILLSVTIAVFTAFQAQGAETKTDRSEVRVLPQADVQVESGKKIGGEIRITAAPKGFGSENMSQMHMFTPSANKEDLMNFVVDVVRQAGGNPCPPMVVGVGFGGDFEYCAYLAKKALCRPVSERNANPVYKEMEDELLKRVNALSIGPQGFGGRTTALAVNIETAPTHIAGLPAAINIGCHVTRHATAVL